ncbi:MAG TPA: glycosyltransferase [Candidatus Binatus sp.]|nr:glycosyltransferase [Candidatus Binatus sp.]
MRILKVVQSYFPFQDRGGPVVKVRALARGLAKRGHQITVLTADLGVKGASNNAAGLKFERNPWGWRNDENGVQTVYLSSLVRYRALTLNPHVIGFCRASISQFDLVHLYGLYDLLGPAASYFCRRHSVPYVIEPMGMYRPIDRSFRLKRLWHAGLGDISWRHATRIVATSEMEAQELLDDGVSEKKVILRYNGIDLDTSPTSQLRGVFREKWGILPQEPLVVFLGRLIPRKGADVLIDAFAQCCPQKGRLVIAGPEGEPGYRAMLEKRAREAGVGSRVIFTGALYDRDKSALLADADIFALPSRYENFANSAAEAIAFGVPVIITEFCGIRSLVSGRAGLVVAPEKMELAKAISSLISDVELYRKLKAGCAEVTAQLGWDRLTEQMEGYYAQVLAGTNGNLR